MKQAKAENSSIHLTLKEHFIELMFVQVAVLVCFNNAAFVGLFHLGSNQSFELLPFSISISQILNLNVENHQIDHTEPAQYR